MHTRTATLTQAIPPQSVVLFETEEMEFTALDLGAHCAFCNRHDFLPFKCDDCGLCFCLEHKDGLKHSAASCTL